jgi:hypothetical protein
MIMKYIIALLLLSSCGYAQLTDTQEEKSYINIDGEDVEFVIDEYENPYLKYTIDGKNMYIPFPFETDDEEEPYKGPMLTKNEKK